MYLGRLAEGAGLGETHMAEGCRPENFPGSAFFSREVEVAEHWANIYHEGYIETLVRGRYSTSSLHSTNVPIRDGRHD